jgi:large subunit ribosomal protein L12
MEYVYAALMLHKLQKEVTEENVTSVVKATGAEVNEAQVKALVASLADVNIEDAIKAAPVAVAAAPAPAVEEASSKGDDKKEAKADPPSEKQEEQAMEGLASLFG